MIKKIKSAIQWTLLFLLGGAGGALVAVFMPPSPLGLLAWFVVLVVGIILHVFVHEVGHLIAGKMSGYDFVSIRFFNLTFIKKDGKLIRKKFKILGTLGQCLMSPPKPIDGQYPFAFYNLGGGLMNFAFSALFFALSFVFPALAWMFHLLAVIGIIVGLIQLVPIKSGGFPNDGYNALTLGKNDVARRALWSILNTNALVTRGCRLRDIPAEHFSMDDFDLSDKDNNALVANVAVTRQAWLMDRHEFAEAKALAESLLNTVDRMPDILKNELRCELLFLELIGECRKEEIDRLYTEDLKKYIKAMSLYVARQRLMYAYAKLFLHDDAEAAKALDKFNKACLSHPVEGEIASERELVALVDDLATEKNNQTA